MKQPNAAYIIIGDEILSGSVQDANLAHLATELGNTGINLREVRVVPDDEEAIINAVNELRGRNDYVFTSGGIGSTHDDITAESVAKAFGVDLVENAEALALMEERYKVRSEAARIMAMIPNGASLIANEVSGAPGFQMGNVLVMAGVPSIFRSMVAAALPDLEHGDPTIATSIEINLREGVIRVGLAEIQGKYSDVQIGSYPKMIEGNEFDLTLKCSGIDGSKVEAAMDEIKTLVKERGGTYRVPGGQDSPASQERKR